MIQCTWVSKSFYSWWVEVSIYHELDRSISSWKIAAIMGPSWSGKSTLLNLLAGLLLPDAGEIIVGGTNISNLSENERTKRRANNIAFIFQQFHLIPNLTVQDNIDLVIDIWNSTKSKTKRRYDTSLLLDMVWLWWYESRYPNQLSGGEQQRVAIARAFVSQVPVLLADEPTGNLDQKNAIIIMNLLVQLQRETNTTIVLITHDAKISTYADNIYHLDSWKLLL
jgi:putative ABC transport system ATP-binding protein